ncbi:hypothetical protein D3C76_1607300 [compost metagenome]
MGRRERQEHAVFATALAVEIQAVDQFVGVADLDHLPQPLQYRTELLEHKVVAVLGTAEILLDVTFVGFRMNDDQHEAAPAVATGDSGTGLVGCCSRRKSARRCCTPGKLQ